MRRIIMSAAIAVSAALGTMQANAAPLNVSHAVVGHSVAGSAEIGKNLVQIRHGGRHYKRNRLRNDWRDRRRARKYSNWRRYNSRPYNWRSRSCVAIGPIWYCP